MTDDRAGVELSRADTAALLEIVNAATYTGGSVKQVARIITALELRIARGLDFEAAQAGDIDDIWDDIRGEMSEEAK